MRYLLLSATLILLAIVAPAPTRAEDALACPDDDLAAVIEEGRALLEDAGAALEDGDAEAAFMLLQQLRVLLSENAVNCTGLAFEGVDQAVIGPVRIPAGVYRLTFTTPGVGSIQVSAIDGECDEGRLLNVRRGQGTDGAKTAFVSEGCLAVIEANSIGATWSLQFELLD